MENVIDVLDNYFKDLYKRPYHSNLSWENCYKFFYNNHKKILDDKESLEIAALQLAFYLASWGMYRGSAFIRNYNHTVFKDLIIELLTNCKNLWTYNVAWNDLDNANNIIKKYCSDLKNKDKSKNSEKYKNIPTQTLITKILMGIFGCVPAYDRFFITALKENQICQTYNEKSFYALRQWWKDQKYNKKHQLKKSDLIYPPMKLVDVYFWSEGKRLEKEKEEKEKN